MAIGKGEQFEHHLSALFKSKDWQETKKSHKWEKTKKHRRERQRAKQDLECDSQYRKYKGYEY